MTGQIITLEGRNMVRDALVSGRTLQSVLISKVSMGEAAYVPLLSMSLFQALTTIKKCAIPVVGVEVDLGTDYAQQNLKGPVAFVLGGEAAGLSEPLKKYCDLFVHIPMVKEVASLKRLV